MPDVGRDPAGVPDDVWPSHVALEPALLPIEDVAVMREGVSRLKITLDNFNFILWQANLLTIVVLFAQLDAVFDALHVDASHEGALEVDLVAHAVLVEGLPVERLEAGLVLGLVVWFGHSQET